MFCYRRRKLLSTVTSGLALSAENNKKRDFSTKFQISQKSSLNSQNFTKI